uniref:Uncharacterized protein n=1 Tax=viral metagenome TaxID=1070528 RepID=A0A6C0H7Y4_9ZZZZ
MLKYFQTTKIIIPIQNKCYDIVIINNYLCSSLLQKLLFYDNHKKLYILNLLLVNKHSIHIENIFLEICKHKIIFINSPLIYGYSKYQIIQILKLLKLSIYIDKQYNYELFIKKLNILDIPKIENNSTILEKKIILFLNYSKKLFNNYVNNINDCKLFYNNLLNISITFFDYIIYDLYDIKYNKLSNISVNNFIKIKKEILNYIIILLKQSPITDNLKLNIFIDLLINNNINAKLFKIERIDKIVKYIININYMKGLLSNNINMTHLEIIIEIIEIAYRGISKEFINYPLIKI